MDHDHQVVGLGPDAAARCLCLLLRRRGRLMPGSSQVTHTCQASHASARKGGSEEGGRGKRERSGGGERGGACYSGEARELERVARVGGDDEGKRLGGGIRPLDGDRWGRMSVWDPLVNDLRRGGGLSRVRDLAGGKTVRPHQQGKREQPTIGPTRRLVKSPLLAPAPCMFGTEY